MAVADGSRITTLISGSTRPHKTAGCLPRCGAWVAHGRRLTSGIIFCFTGDLEFLRDMYNVLKGAVQFFLDFIVEKDGYLVTSPSLSPEHVQTAEW